MISIRRDRAFTRACAALAVVTLLAACGKEESAPPATAAPGMAAGSDWVPFRDQYIESYFKAHPTAAVGAGRHEFDGQLPDWSADGIAAEIRRLHGERDRAAAFADSQLDESQRFERDYLLVRIDQDLFWLETAEAPFRNPTFYLGNIDSLDPSVYLTRNYAPLEQRMQAYTGYARAIPGAVAQIRANLRTPLPQTAVERGISAFGGFAEFYSGEVSRVFESVKEPALQKELAAANSAAAKAMRELAGWFEGERRNATQDFALGAEKFARMLEATERVTTPLEELDAVGRADLDRNLAAVREACAEFAPGAAIEACFRKVGGDKPEGGPVQGAREQLAGLKKFIVDKGVVTIPGTEEALVAEAPPYNRANFAYIDIPGAYEKGLPSVYYIAPPDPTWTPQVQRDYLPGRADLLFTSVHEVWPGHFLQFLHSNRTDSLVGRLFVGYAFAEGWAHYSEEMMWEMGLEAGNPETHIGQLSNALLRNVRFLCSIGMHTRGMSVAECEKMFREKAYQDVGNSKQQAARGTLDPAYLNYTMGKLMIRKLRADWTASRGGRAAWREFHDKFLSYGGPPVPMVRAAMLGNAEGPLF